MLPTTLKLCRTAFEADPSISIRERQHLMRLLIREPEPTTTERQPVAPRLVRRKEGAQRLGYSLRTFDKLCKQGVLKKHILPGRCRAAGVLESDLLALLTERSTAA